MMLRAWVHWLMAKLPIVRLMQTHRDERALAEQERERLKREQHLMTQRMHVVGWLADVRADPRRPERSGDGD